MRSKPKPSDGKTTGDSTGTTTTTSITTIIKPGILNVIGEKHDESDPRRDLEKAISAKFTRSSLYWQEGEFRMDGATAGSDSTAPFADPFYLRADQHLITIRNFSEDIIMALNMGWEMLQDIDEIDIDLFILTLRPGDLITYSLEQFILFVYGIKQGTDNLSSPQKEVYANLFEAGCSLKALIESSVPEDDIKGAIGKIPAVEALTLIKSQITEKNLEPGGAKSLEEIMQEIGEKADSVDVLDTISEYITADFQQYLVKELVKDKLPDVYKRTKSHLSLMYNTFKKIISLRNQVPDLPVMIGEGQVLENSIRKNTAERSSFMHRAAQQHYNTPGVWKIGHEHYIDLLKYDDRKYNLISKDEFGTAINQWMVAGPPPIDPD